MRSAWISAEKRARLTTSRGLVFRHTSITCIDTRRVVYTFGKNRAVPCLTSQCKLSHPIDEAGSSSGQVLDVRKCKEEAASHMISSGCCKQSPIHDCIAKRTSQGVQVAHWTTYLPELPL